MESAEDTDTRRERGGAATGHLRAGLCAELDGTRAKAFDLAAWAEARTLNHGITAHNRNANHARLAFGL